MDLITVIGYGAGAAVALIVIAIVFAKDDKAIVRSDGRAWKGVGTAILLIGLTAMLIGSKYPIDVAGTLNIGLLQERELLFTGAFAAFILGAICVATGALLGQSSGGSSD